MEVPRSSSLRPPASQHVPASSAARLNGIAEDGSNPTTALPERTPLRSIMGSINSLRRSLDTRTPPPMYKSQRQWLEELELGEDDGNARVEGEKLAALRDRDRRITRNHRTIGCLWIVLLVCLVLVVVIALGVGLGVGLNHDGSTADNANADQGAGQDSTPAFPVGTWGIQTNLRTTQTNCTSNPDTWFCPTDAPTASSASYNWIISNTSEFYSQNATIRTGTKIPANLTISSTDDLRGIPMKNVTLDYLTDESGIATLLFNFTMSKKVTPTVALTADNSASVCFFNNTIVSGSLTLPASSVNVGMQNGVWPSTVEIVESSQGGDDVPACYKTYNNIVGERITTGLQPEPLDDQCLCRYTTS